MQRCILIRSQQNDGFRHHLIMILNKLVKTITNTLYLTEYHLDKYAQIPVLPLMRTFDAGKFQGNDVLPLVVIGTHTVPKGT
eukprot:scaffold22205_cov65-Attheya_sp.AAC.3